MEELLEEIHHISNPVIVVGDLNTTGSDSTPTSIENMLYKRYGSVDFWTTKGVQWATGVGLVYSGAKAAMKLSGIQYRIDPTSANIPGASPNLERGLFDKLKHSGLPTARRSTSAALRNGPAMGDRERWRIRTNVGRTVSFPASPPNSSGAKSAWRNSSWIGCLYGAISEPTDVKAPYLFAPHFGRTMGDLNNCLPEPISDHSPMTVDLPFHEAAGLGSK